MHSSPLVWPEFIERSKTRDYTTFRFGIIDAVSELYRAVIDFGDKTGKPIENIIISYDEQTGEHTDTAAALFLRWNGVVYAFAVDRFYTLEGNLHALRFIIEYKTQTLRFASLEVVRLGLIGFQYPIPNYEQETAQ